MGVAYKLRGWTGILVSLSGIVFVVCMRELEPLRCLLNARRWIKLIVLTMDSPELLAGGGFEKYNTKILNLYYLLSWGLTKLVGPEYSPIIIYWIIIVLLAASLYYCLLRFSENHTIALVGTLVLLVSNTLSLASMGANATPFSGPYNVWMCLSLLVLCVGFSVSSNYLLFTVSACLAFLIHQPIGIMAMVCLMPGLLARDFAKWRTVLLCGLSYSLLVGVLYLFQSSGKNVFDGGDAWFHNIRLFNYGHLLLNPGGGQLHRALSFFVLVAGGLAVSQTMGGLRAVLQTNLLFGGLFVACAAVAVELLPPIKIVYLLMPMRASLFVATVALLALTIFLLRTLWHGGLRGAVAALGACLLATGTYHGLLFSLLITCLLCAWRQSGLPRKLSLGCCLVILACIIPAWPYISGSESRLLPHAQRLVLILLPVAVAVAIWRNPGSKWRNYLVGVSLVVFLVLMALTPPRSGCCCNQAKTNDFVAACLAAKEHLPAGVPFLVIPEASMPIADAVAERGTWLQVRKMAWTYGAPHLLPSFSSFYKALGVPVADFSSRSAFVAAAEKAWLSLDATAMMALANKFHAAASLTYAKHHIQLPIIYSGRYFRLYQIPGVIK